MINSYFHGIESFKIILLFSHQFMKFNIEKFATILTTKSLKYSLD